MARQNQRVYAFGPFRLDPGERRLTHDDVPVALTPKAFQTLKLLVDNAGHLVDKQRFLDEIWSGSIVEEATLAKNIFTLRKALGDDQGAPRFIETVPKVGYRFTVDGEPLIRFTGPSTAARSHHFRRIIDQN